MRGPSLQRTTLLSAALHLTFFLLAALILRHSRNPIMPSPYEVSLVGPISSARGAAREDTPAQARDAEGPAVRETEQVKQPEKAVKDPRADQKALDEQIAALKAKKKMRDIVDMRRKVASVSGSQSRTAEKSAAQGATGSPQGSLFDRYYGKITDQIRQEWAWPTAGERNLDAVIAVKIARDGTITVQGIEKSSGNALFDRSALRALAKASPVAPPPYEMEIGMRFYP